MTNKTMSEPSIPSLMKMIGKTMMLEPIMVLAIEVITLKELSPPCYTIRDFLNVFIFYIFISSGMCFYAEIMPICTETSVEFYSIMIYIYLYNFRKNL